MKKEIKSMEEHNGYDSLIDSVGVLLEQARKTIYSHANKILVKTYWEIGKRIVDFEQGGKEKAEYGSQLFEKIAHDLREKYGKGFSRSNVIYMRIFYIRYSKSQTVSDQLSWSHYRLILRLDTLANIFHSKEAVGD